MKLIKARFNRFQFPLILLIKNCMKNYDSGTFVPVNYAITKIQKNEAFVGKIIRKKKNIYCCHVPI